MQKPFATPAQTETRLFYPPPYHSTIPVSINNDHSHMKYLNLFFFEIVKYYISYQYLPNRVVAS